MIPEKIQKAFNEQIMHETYSAWLYLSMAAWLESEGFEGMGQWMRVQTQEELSHAMKFYNHILERGGTVELLAIEKPPAAWDSPLAAFEAALGHERFITGKINELMALSIKENDFASRSMLQWFVDEQVEEEDNATRNVQKIGMVGERGQGMLMLDREMGQRTFVYPAAVASPASGGGE